MKLTKRQLSEAKEVLDQLDVGSSKSCPRFEALSTLILKAKRDNKLPMSAPALAG